MTDKITEFIKQSDINIKVWNWIKWVFISILLIVFFGYLFFKRSKGNCAHYYDYINQSYSGKVVSKYLNRKDHMHKTIQLDNNIIYKINPFDQTAYFDSIYVGDILIKNAGSLKYYIVKQNDTLLFETKEKDCIKYLKDE